MPREGAFMSNTNSDGFKFSVGQKVFHPFYGVGTVLKKDQEKKILGEKTRFSIIDFENRKMQIMVNAEQEYMIHELVTRDEIPEVFDVIKETLPLR